MGASLLLFLRAERCGSYSTDSRRGRLIFKDREGLLKVSRVLSCLQSGRLDGPQPRTFGWSGRGARILEDGQAGSLGSPPWWTKQQRPWVRAD